MTRAFNRNRPVLLLRAYGQRPGGKAGKERVQRAKRVDESDALAADRLEAIVAAERERQAALNKPEPDCRARYLEWLRAGPDQRYYPLNVWGQ